MNLDIKALVQGSSVLVYYKQKTLYYKTEGGFIFPIPIDDCGDTTFNNVDRSMLFMKWIKRAVVQISADKEDVD